MALEEKQLEEFRKQIANMSLDQLKTELSEVEDRISKMILDSDLVIKAAILKTLIKEKEND